MPVNALAEDGVPPEEGDSVQFSVQGKVQSVDGNMATVEIDSINGEPIGEESDEGSEEEAGEQGGSGAASGGGGPQPPVQASGLSDTMRGPLAPMGGAMKAPAPNPALARNRLDRAGTAAMRNRLMKGARNTPLPF